MHTTSKPSPARPSAGHRFDCVTCEMPIEGKPTFHVGLAFCCAGCAVSGPCTCSYDDRPSAADVAAAARACGCLDDAGFTGSPAPQPADSRHWLAEPIPALSRR